MRTLVLGFDAFDPSRFEHLSDAGVVPNLTRYADSGGYSRLAVATPPQTEVSWTSIATGLDPGGHGIFDFVHRDPATYRPYVSLLPTKRNLFGTSFSPPFKAHTIFDEVAQQGFPATVLWWPATFPAQPGSLTRTIPGLGTPDIRGRIGVGTLFSTDEALAEEERKTPVETLTRSSRGRFSAVFRGPASRKRNRIRESTAELQLEVLDDETARLAIGGHSYELRTGFWSPILEIPFKVGRFASVRSLTRVILTGVRPNMTLYALPLQIHPLHTPWRYANPRSFVKQTWRECGPFLTLGWPQDTTALEEQCITDRQFLALCESIFEARKQVLAYHVQRFSEGILASVFDSLDRVQHMFWRDRPDIVDEWYVKMDALVGTVEKLLPKSGKEQTKLFIMSDHGFSDFNHKAHVNRWLVDRGYLTTKDGGESGSLQNAAWSKSQAYAVGLNSLYLNQVGREGEGCIQPDHREPLIAELRRDLLDWRGPGGEPVVQQVLRREEAFSGPFADRGPDMVIGFKPGYRASSETGLGRWGRDSLESNHDHWGADHCMDARAVPGVLFASQNIADHSHLSYRDVPMLTVGMEPMHDDSAPPSAFDSEDQEIIEERLEGLGYL
jgi:predicted AlkP superfamily phosphohydrolase/phosphomutase